MLLLDCLFAHVPAMFDFPHAASWVRWLGASGCPQSAATRQLGRSARRLGTPTPPPGVLPDKDMQSVRAVIVDARSFLTQFSTDVRSITPQPLEKITKKVTLSRFIGDRGRESHTESSHTS